MHYDTIIVGGSFAGLSAAMYLARARRSVLVLDTGKPRNRFAKESHGFFAQDGSSPLAMLETMRRQVGAYPTVRFFDRMATDAVHGDGGFRVTLNDGEAVLGSTVLLAFGVSDVLPDLEGVAQRWGGTVIHCPYCHGYEFSGQRLGVLNLSKISGHQATLITEWGPTTFFLDGGTLDPELRAELKRRGAEIEPRPVARLVGQGVDLSGVQLQDGTVAPIDALFIGPAYRFNSGLPKVLGCAVEDGPLGPTLTVNDMKATTVSGVYAAGDITRGGHTVAFASADGVMAALAIHRSLAFGV
ncbi:NAD(P)/FAD-dependent oxidoreductase [Paracoccus litorisediminis]|uniref:NAD(P)/FAD-dependent oxidoreductase n=1 Tax=Paracoccus litorisediminis TaxID=2006130 RepID=UPI003730C3B3